MDLQQLQHELSRFDPSVPIEASPTPPASWYLEPEFLELEKHSVFRQSWQPAGRLDQVASAGDYFTGQLLGEPYVVLRDAQGRLRAFYNVCCHHGAPVAAAEGCSERLVCPYHGWTYSLDGRLQSAPRLGRLKNFDVSDFQLKPITVESWGPFVFLHFGSNPRPLAEELKPLYHRLKATRFERLKFITRRRYTLHCNWKVYVDNYLDGGYHVSLVHRGLAGQLDLDAYRTEIFDRVSIQSCAGLSCTAGDQPLAEEKDFGERIGERIGEGAIYAWLYPNFMINRYGPIMDTNWVVPLAPDRTLTVFDYYFAEAKNPSGPQSGSGENPAEEAFIQRSLAASHQVQDEDVRICESVQVGLASSAYDQGRYAPSVETGEYHFHCLLQGDLERGLKSQLATP